jgi:hypothetical protein
MVWIDSPAYSRLTITHATVRTRYWGEGANNVILYGENVLISKEIPMIG